MTTHNTHFGTSLSLGSMQPQANSRTLFEPFGEQPGQDLPSTIAPKEILKGLEEVKDEEKLKRIDFVLNGSFP